MGQVYITGRRYHGWLAFDSLLGRMFWSCRMPAGVALAVLVTFIGPCFYGVCMHVS